jgi:hypothetical protein
MPFEADVNDKPNFVAVGAGGVEAFKKKKPR